MTPDQFIENFLPGYDKILSIFWNSYQDKLNNPDLFKLFNEKYFDLALENYTNIICRKQRELCSEEADFDQDMLRDSCGLGSGYYRIDREGIINSSQPNINK